MKCSVNLAHPTPGSFNHALADAAVARLKSQDVEVNFHDLYAENFDPVTPTEEIPKQATLPPEIEQHCQEICDADGIVIVHPNWWSQPPAILKGWIDRVLRAGRAYNFVTGPNGEGQAVGLLKATTALVITTANTPQDIEVKFLGDPLELFWRKVVFGLCGVAKVQRVIISPVIVSTLEQRQQWLREVEQAIDRLWNG
jgi:putative NADPH-quinone reductase